MHSHTRARAGARTHTHTHTHKDAHKQTHAHAHFVLAGGARPVGPIGYREESKKAAPFLSFYMAFFY